MIRMLVIFMMLVSAAVASAQSGSISGRLTYPAEGIPRDLDICVVKVGNAKAAICSKSGAAILRAEGVRFKVNRANATYSVTLPSGSYYIYATTGEMPGHKAYYNEFVRCGMSVDCRSTERIRLTVRPGKTVTGIMVGDFWNVGGR